MHLCAWPVRILWGQNSVGRISHGETPPHTIPTPLFTSLKNVEISKINVSPEVWGFYLSFFQEMFDRMPKDGRETQWRALCENESSENIALPDKMDDVYTPMQRLLVIRAVRPDRIMQLSTLFVQTVLGKRYGIFILTIFSLSVKNLNYCCDHFWKFEKNRRNFFRFQILTIIIRLYSSESELYNYGLIF